MTTPTADNEVVQLSWPIHGQITTTHLMPTLVDALFAHLPNLNDSEHTAVLPLKAVRNGLGGWLLSKRLRLHMRALRHHLPALAQLEGTTLTFGIDSRLSFGAMTVRSLTPSRTVNAHCLCLAERDEGAFLVKLEHALATLMVRGQAMCGRAQEFHLGDTSHAGYSVAVSGLTPHDAIVLQSNGVGEFRRYGCGVFLPYKRIDLTNE